MPDQTSSRSYALVTGAAGGLGRAFVQQLTAAGWRVAMVDCDQDALAQARDELNLSDDQVRLETLDVAKLDAWRSLVSRLSAEWPRLDLLVNNAGVAGEGELGVMPIEDWDWILQTNLYSVVYGCHACIDWLLSNDRGARVINVASTSGLFTTPAMGAYCASKAGVVALSEAMHAELKPHGVRVTILAPGFFKSGLLDRGRFGREDRRDWAQRMSANTITRDEVAAAGLAGSERGRLYVVAPFRARLLWRFKRWFPTLWVKLVGRAFHRSFGGRDKRE